MRRVFKKVLVISLVLFLCCKVSFALSEGGITISQNTGDTIRTGTIFSTYALTSTDYVYNNSGGTSTTDGWITVENFKKVLVLIQPEIIHSGTITARLECKAFEGSIIGSLVSIDYGTNTSIATSIPLLEAAYQVRLGYAVTSPTGSGTVNAAIRLEKN